MTESPGLGFGLAIKKDAGIDVWVEQEFRIHPAFNPDLHLTEPLKSRVGRDFRSHMTPTIQQYKTLTIAFGENLWIIDDPMEIMLILEARAGYRGLRAKLAADARSSSRPASPSGSEPSSGAGSEASSDED